MAEQRSNNSHLEGAHLSFGRALIFCLTGWCIGKPGNIKLKVWPMNEKEGESDCFVSWLVPLRVWTFCQSWPFSHTGGRCCVQAATIIFALRLSDSRNFKAKIHEFTQPRTKKAYIHATLRSQLPPKKESLPRDSGKFAKRVASCNSDSRNRCSPTLPL